MEIALIGIAGGGFGLMISGLILINWRVGKIEGRLNNGDFLRCPFYKKGNKKCSEDDKE